MSAPKKAAAPPPSKEKKKKAAVEEDEDEDEEEFESKKSAKKKTPAKKKKKAASDDEEDDEEEFQSKKSAKKKTLAKKTASEKKPVKKKAKKEEEEEPEEDDEEKEASSSEDIPLGQLAAKQSKDKADKQKKGKAAADGDAPVWEWWNEPPLPKGVKWRTLEHNGVVFAPPYEAHGVKMRYNGVPIALSSEAEERATHYARYLTTAHVTKPQFNANFFKEFAVLANKGRTDGVKLTDFAKCDFQPLKDYLDAEKEKKKARSKEEKDKEKTAKKELQEKYGYATVDGHKQKVGNYMVEPPGIFLGRGNHPKTGMWKRRLTPDDVTLNLGPKAPVPPSPVPGHKWKAVLNNDKVTWLAGWDEGLQGNKKYVMLGASSRTKGQSDMAKFDKARKLKDHINDIRTAYKRSWTSDVEMERQRGVVVYLIDKLALRVGGEKDTENTADTVGSTSLRVEHIELREPNILVLDFLGKDSMRYYNTTEVEPLVYKNLKAFVKGKAPGDQVFDEVDPGVVNAYLKEFMPGLSAKVFRTYNASITLQKELSDMDADLSLEEKIVFYNRANKQVALLCNHKRSLPPTHAEGMKKLETLKDELEASIKELEAHQKLIKAGKKPIKREKVVNEEGEEEERPPLPTDPEKIESQLAKVQERLEKLVLKMRDKADNAEVALGTSKINYNDPRVTAAWCKKYDVPLAKVFSATLRQKFPWAQVATKDWKF